MLAALILAWRLGRRIWPLAAVAAVAAVALAVDGLAPLQTPADAAARAASRGATAVAVQLGREAQRTELRTLLYGTGGEALPEQAFASAQTVAAALPFPADAVVLTDERGVPVAWTGPLPRMPLRLRPLGGRVMAAEPGIGAVWLWWREPVFEAGRLVGTVLVGLENGERGSRRLLGAWAGRAGALRARLDGGRPLTAASGERVMGLEVAPAPPVWWSRPGWTVVVAAVLAATGAAAAPAAVLLLGAGALAVLTGWAGGGWWLVLGLAAAALLLHLLPRRPVAWAVGAAAVFALAWLQPAVTSELAVVVSPERLLSPGIQVVAIVFAWLLILRAVASRSPSLPWPAALLAWAVLAAGSVTARPLVLGVGMALVAVAGLPRRTVALAALAGAALLIADGDARHRSELVASTETTLARLENVDAPARSFLISLPESALEGLARLDPREQTVVLGRLARWLGFSDVVPGGTLAMITPAGEAAGTWGENPFIAADPPREIAARTLPSGWRIAVLMAPPPHNVLTALVVRGIGVPVAAFDRGGSAVGRGAIFRPLTPAVVGGALAAGRSWDHVGVGEREFSAYLRSRGDVIVAVPWIRPPFAEWLLLVAALALWPAAVLTIWEHRSRLSAWWGERRTFAGRVRLVTVAATVLPVLLLGQFLPRQWSYQRDQVRLELARAVSQTLASPQWDSEVGWLVREAGATVVV